MTRRVFSFLSLLLLGCAASRAQTPAPCEPQMPTDAAYWADVAPMPEGTGKFSYSMDMRQTEDASAPVVVTGMQGVTSRQHRGGKLRCVEIENRSARTVRAVQLGWTVTARDDAEKKVLARGRLPLIEVQIAPGRRQKAEPQGTSFSYFLLPLVQKGVHAGDHDLRLHVARAEFTDGTVFTDGAVADADDRR